MKKCQKILCAVESCQHNKENENFCTLDSIQVSATSNTDTGTPYEETLCASYKPQEKKN